MIRRKNIFEVMLWFMLSISLGWLIFLGSLVWFHKSYPVAEHVQNLTDQKSVYSADVYLLNPLGLYITVSLNSSGLIALILSVHLFIKSRRQSQPFPKRIIGLLILAIILISFPILASQPMACHWVPGLSRLK